MPTRDVFPASGFLAGTQARHYNLSSGAFPAPIDRQLEAAVPGTGRGKLGHYISCVNTVRGVSPCYAGVNHRHGGLRHPTGTHQSGLKRSYSAAAVSPPSAVSQPRSFASHSSGTLRSVAAAISCSM